MEDSLAFWQTKREEDVLSVEDKCLMLFVIGGVPRYLEAVSPKLSLVENVNKLCFEKSGLLFDEFEKLFSEMFSKRAALYQKIVTPLVSGPLEAKEIAAKIGMSLSGDIYEYLDELVQSKIVAKDYAWYFKNGQVTKLSRYRLKDNYCRFYLKYILPNKEKILKGKMCLEKMTDLVGFDSMMNLHFQNLVLHHRNQLIKALRIDFNELVFAGPYFQRKTSRQPGCQIDFLVQTRYNTLFVCMIKFTTKDNEITMQAKEEMQTLLKRLKMPKGFSCVPVLVHFGPVNEWLEDERYFFKVVDFQSFFV